MPDLIGTLSIAITYLGKAICNRRPAHTAHAPPVVGDILGIVVFLWNCSGGSIILKSLPPPLDILNSHNERASS